MKKFIIIYFIVSLIAVVHGQQTGSVNQRLRTLETGFNAAQKDSLRSMIGYINVKDYGAVGDSVTDDTQAFQSAFDYIHSIGGGTLIIPEGIYRIDPIVADTGMTNFTMIGYDAVLKANDGLGSYSLLQFPLGSHITIEDIEFNGNRDNLTATGHNCLYFARAEYITIENCYIHNFKDLADDPAVGGSGMLLIESEHATIINNTISGTDVGIYPIGLYDFVISGNKIFEGVSEGIALDVGFWAGKRNVKGVISDNLMHRSITLNCGSDIVISGNTILEQNIAGLLIGLQDAGTFADSCYAENINVSNNLISSTVYIGYSLSSGNTSNATRFYAEDVSFTNNIINADTAGGIYIFTGNNIDIRNNLISVQIGGVNSLIQSFPDSTYLKNITIENNTLRTNQDTVIYGIITSGYPLYIKNNIVTGNYTTGIYVLTQSDKLDSVYVSNNITSATLVYANGTPDNVWDNIASNITAGSQIFQDSYIFTNTLNIDTVTFLNGSAVVQVWGDTNIDSITTKPSGSVLYLKFQDTLRVNNSTKNIKLRTTTPLNYRSTSLSTLTLISSGNYWWEFARSNDKSLIGLSDTASVTDGYVQKYISGELVWSADIATAGSGTFNPDGVTIDTTAGGLARVLPAKVTKWDSVTFKQDLDADLTDLSDGELTASKVGGVKDADYGDVTVSSGAWAVEDNSHSHTIANVTGLQDSLNKFLETGDSTIYLTPSDAASAYATTSHTHTEFFDTVRVTGWSVGMGNTDIDTITTGSFGGIKIENNYTITEVSAYTNTGTITFNIEERAEVTPNTTGVDVITSDLVADNDQQETGTFSNAAIDRDDWLVLTIVSITGDPTIFSVTVRGVKTN